MTGRVSVQNLFLSELVQTQKDDAPKTAISRPIKNSRHIRIVFGSLHNKENIYDI